MSFKRKAEDDIEIIANKKHTLDSDEEDSERDEEDAMNESDIEGEEDGVAGVEDEVKITPFNMKEELEEGYFDKSGHYHWRKESQVQDNWLDNIDWLKIKSKKESSTSADADAESKLEVFNSKEAYAKIIEMMEPKETIKKALQRFGKKTMKLSSVERLRRKKNGIVDEASESIAKLTELANEILTHTGNMDVYDETYEKIKSKIGSGASTSKASESLDMYADDFDVKEKTQKATEEPEQEPEEVRWEYKWKESDTEIHGPFSTQQMQIWTDEEYFKKPVLVRKVDSGESFYSSSRIDFELYL